MDRRKLLQGLGAGVAMSFAPPPAWAQGAGRWVRFESPNFICFTAGDESRARQEMVELERFHALLASLMPRSERSPLKLKVYVASGNQQFERSNPGMGKTIAGYYDSSAEQIRAVTAPDRAYERQRNMKRNIRAMDARVVLFHEYAHHFLRANSRRTYPRWYNEGFAEFVSTAVFDKDATLVGMFTSDRAIWLTIGDWLDIDKFLVGGPFDREDTSMFYAQAWLATHYLFVKPERAAGFDRYCIALQGGGDPLESFEPAFGISRGDFDRELKKYKRDAIQIRSLIPDTTDYAATIASQRLTAGADELMMPLSYLQSVPPRDYAKETVELVRKEAKKHAGDPFAQYALAHVEVWYGELATARTQLDALLASQPDNPDIQHLSGLCDLRMAHEADDEALFKRARGAFAKAHRLDGARAISLFRYVECVLAIDGEISDHAIDVLVNAYKMAPQINALAYVTTQALIQHERWEEAELVITPLSSSAHGEDERARALLAAVKAKQQPDFVFYASAARLSDEFE